MVERSPGAGGPLPAARPRRGCPPRRLPRRQHPRQPGAAQHRHRLWLPRPRGGVRHQREPDPLQPRRYLFPRPARRPAEHPAGLGSGRGDGDPPRHHRRHRPAVAQLARRKTGHGLRRDAAQHPGAAPALLLVHPDHGGAPRLTPGAQPAARRVPEQPGHAPAGAGRGSGLPVRRPGPRARGRRSLALLAVGEEPPGPHRPGAGSAPG